MKKILIIESGDCENPNSPSVTDVRCSYKNSTEADIVLAELPESPDHSKRFIVLKHRDFETGGIIDYRYVACVL